MGSRAVAAAGKVVKLAVGPAAIGRCQLGPRLAWHRYDFDFAGTLSLRSPSQSAGRFILPTEIAASEIEAIEPWLSYSVTERGYIDQLPLARGIIGSAHPRRGVRQAIPPIRCFGLLAKLRRSRAGDSDRL